MGVGLPGTTEQERQWSAFMCLCWSPLQSRQGLPQWTLSHFRQAPPLTDHAAAFRGLRKHQRQLWFCIPVRALQPLELPRLTSPAPLIPTAIFNDFPKTHSGFSGSVHHSGRVKWDSCSLFRVPLVWAASLSLSQCLSLSVSLSLSLHDARLPWAKGGWRESLGRESEPEITAQCASMTV